MKKTITSLLLGALLLPTLAFGAVSTFSQGGTNNAGPYASGTAIVSDGVKFYGMATSSLGLPTFADILNFVTTNTTQTITGLKTFTLFPEVSGSPTTTNQLVNKGYVDSLYTTGSRFVDTATAGTITALPANTYNNGASGVGATLTGNVNGALTAQDGITLTAGQTLLVKDEVTQANNGFYTVTTVGNAGTPYVLTRSTNYDVQAEIQTGTFFNILSGSTQANKQYIMNNNTTITVGTTAITFALLSASNVYTASQGIALSGFNFVLNLLFNGGLGISGGQVYVATDNSTIVDPTTNSNLLAVKNKGITALKLANGALDVSSTTLLTGLLPIANGGTGVGVAPTNGQLLIGGTSGYYPNTLTAGANITITNGSGTISIASTGGGGGGASATTSFGATIGTIPFISSLSTNQSMGIAPTSAVDQEFGSTAAASSTISRRTQDLSRVDAYYINAYQVGAGVAGQTLRLQCSRDGITWSDAGDANGKLSIAAAAPTPKATVFTNLSTNCKSSVILRLVSNGGNGVANPSFRTLNVVYRLTQGAAGTTATSSQILPFLAVTTAQALTNMVLASTTYTYGYFDTTNSTQVRLSKNQTVAGASTARFNLQCSADGTNYFDASSDANRYLSIFAVGTTSTDWLNITPTCTGNVSWRLQGQGGNAVADPAFTNIQAEFNTTQQVLGDSNWQFTGTSAIRPTTTVGLIVSASSTFSDLTLSGSGTTTGTSTVGTNLSKLTFGFFDYLGEKIPTIFASSTFGPLGILNGSWYVKQDTDTLADPVIGLISNDLSVSSTISMDPSSGVLSVSSGGTTTADQGIDISDGCFAVNGTCISGGGGSGLFTYIDPFITPASSSPILGRDWPFYSLSDGPTNAGLFMGSLDGSISAVIGFATNTDALSFSGATGGYNFDNDTTITGTSTLATTTTSNLNGVIVVDGVRFTRDGAGIQSAINFCAANGGGKIYLPKGLYLTSSTITFPFDAKCKLVGPKFQKGNDSGSQIRATAVMENLIEVKGNASATTNTDLNHDNGFEYIYLNGNNLATTTLYALNVDTLTFERGHISGSINGIYADYNGVYPPTASSIPGALMIKDNIIEVRSNLGGKNIYMNTQTQSWITNNWFEGPASTTVTVASSTKIKIIGNEFNSADTSVAFGDSSDQGTSNVVVNGNTFNPGTTANICTDTRVNTSNSNYTSFIANSYSSGLPCTIFNQGETVIQAFKTLNNGNILFMPNGTGQIGIGTTTPQSSVDISLSNPTLALTDDPGFYHGGADPAGRFVFQNTADSLRLFRGTIGVSASEIHRFTTLLDTSNTVDVKDRVAGVFSGNSLVLFGTSTAYINNGNNFAVGTTSPWARLSVQGTYGSTTNLLDLASSTSSTGNATTSLFSVAYTGNTTITAANVTPLTTTPGNLSIKTNNAQAINVGGSISLGGNNDNAATAFRVFGTVEGRKENGTTGNSDGYLMFKTNTGGSVAERLRITSIGRVGVGSSTPGDMLVVSGTTTSNVFNSTSTTATSTFGHGILLSTGCIAYPTGCIVDSQWSDTAFGINYAAGGTVGIGSSTSFARLGIENITSGMTLAINDVVNDSTPTVIDDKGYMAIGTQAVTTQLLGSNQLVIATSTNNSARLITNDTVGLRLTNSSNAVGAFNGIYFGWPTSGDQQAIHSVYYGNNDNSMLFSGGGGTATTTDDTPLTLRWIGGVVSRVGISSTTPYAKLGVTNVGTFPSFIVEDSTSPDTTPFLIDASGNVGILDGTPTEGTLTVGGTLYVLTNTAVGADPLCWDGSGGSLYGDCTSLAKYKTNVVDLKAGLKEILKVQPRNFDWKYNDDGTLSETNDYDRLEYDAGFIAEEVDTVSKDFGRRNPDGELQDVNERGLLGALVNSVKELNTKIDNLKTGAVEAKRSVEEDWQNLALLLLFLIVGVQGYFIIKLNKK